MGERRWVEVIHSDPGVPPTADHRWSWVNRGWVSDKLDDAEALDSIALARCDRDHVRLGHGVGCLGDEFQTWVRENRSVVLRVILPDVDPKELAESVVITERGDFLPITSSDFIPITSTNRHPTGVLLDLARSLLAAMTEGETE